MTDVITATAGYDWTDLDVKPPPVEPCDPPDPEKIRRIITTAASTMRMRPTKWLYEGRLASGSINLLAGREGIGKSTIAFDIGAQLTRGELPGRYFGKPQHVGVVASEDAWESVILPRLVAADAILERVHRIEVENPEGGLETVSAPNDLERLRKTCSEHGIRLLIIDPIMSVISGTLDTHKDREVRQALDPLSRFAASSGVGILGLIHVNKSSTTDPLNSIMASRAFTAVARSVLYCILDPECEHEDSYLFGHPKCNVGPKQPTIKYRIIGVEFEVPVDPDDPDYEEGDDPITVVRTSKIQWGSEDDRSIRDALEGPPVERAKGETNGALYEWIAAQDRVVSRAEIVDQFPAMKPATVDKNLSRMVQGGQLDRPFNGHYSVVVKP